MAFGFAHIPSLNITTSMSPYNKKTFYDPKVQNKPITKTSNNFYKT
ncbi:hypothetical protein [Acinetobacter bereziniae]|nr:hypothetical protein [Acinetobacter bereziniae]